MGDLKALETFLLAKTCQVIWAWGISQWTSFLVIFSFTVTDKPSSVLDSNTTLKWHQGCYGSLKNVFTRVLQSLVPFLLAHPVMILTWQCNERPIFEKRVYMAQKRTEEILTKVLGGRKKDQLQLPDFLFLEAQGDKKG